MIEKFKIEIYSLPWEMSVEIDTDFTYDEGKTVDDAMEEMLKFWTDGEERIEREGDVKTAFLKMLCERVFRLSADNNYNSRGMVLEFQELEGWCPMDGSYGIRIIDADTVALCSEDFIVSPQ